jgi:hypothetical protein
MMTTDTQHDDVLEGEMTAEPSRALVVQTVQLSSIAFTPLLTVLAAQLSGEPSETASTYSAAMQSYRAVAARVPHFNDIESE